MAAAAPGRRSMLLLALCLAAAAAAPPAAADHEAELMRIIQELQADVQVLQRNVTEMSRRHSADEGGEGAAQKLAGGEPEVDHDLVAESFSWIKVAAMQDLEPLLLRTSTFWISLLMILQWHIRFHFAEPLHKFVFKGRDMLKHQTKPFMTLRRLGLNVVIFNIYFNCDLPLPHFLTECIRHRRFCCSAFLIFADTVLVFYLFMALRRRCGWRPPPSSKDENEYIDPLNDDADDGRCPQKSNASNIYEDLTVKFRKAVPIFFVQIMLLGFYLQFLNGSHKTKKIEDVNMVYWVVAVVFTVEGGGSQVGEAFNQVYWDRIISMRMCECLSGCFESRRCECCEGVTGGTGNGGHQLLEKRKTMLEEKESKYQESFNSLSAEYHRIFMDLGMPFCVEWRLRMLMDWMVNSVSRSLILYTVPIVISVEEPLDFVKDLTAVMFMTTLDDSDAKRAVEEILVKLKFELYRSRYERGVFGAMKRWALSAMGYKGEPAPSDNAEISLTDIEETYVREHPDKFELLTDLDERFTGFCHP